MRTSDYIFLALTGILATVYRILNQKIEKIIPKEIIRETILSIIISIVIIPAIMEYWGLSIRLGIGLSGIINIFVKIIMVKLEQKVGEKIENL
jgi:hypothetical protein